MGETLAFEAALNASNFLSGINQMVQGMGRVEHSGSSVSSGLASSLSAEKGKFASIGASIGQDLTQSIGGQFGAAGNVATSLATSLGPVGIAAGVAGVALVGMGAASVSVAGNFQQSMANVNSVLGGSAETFKQLSDVAREAGATTQFSASQAADALYFMASAGFNAQQSSAALKDVLNLASAGGLDLARASDLTTSALAQYSLKAEDAGRVTNVMAAAAAKSNSDVGQMGDALTAVGAFANSFGMSIEATAAALGVMANGGIKGAEAGTSLRGMLAGLATETKNGAGALEELGLTYADVNPQTHDFATTMDLLQQKGMTATQALALFGRENVSGATYTAAHAKELKGLQDSITGTNQAATMAAIQNSTYEGSMKEMSSAVEEAEIALGTLLLPALTDTVKLLTTGITAATDFGKAISGAVGTVVNSGTDAAILDFFGYEGTANKAPVQPATLDMGKMAGDTYADGVAQGIGSGTSKEAIATAITESMTSDQAQAALASAGQDAAKVFGNQFQAQARLSGLTDMQAFGIINNQTDSAKGVIPTIGKTSIAGFDFSVDTNYDLKTPLGVEHFTGSADWASRGPSVMASILGRPLEALESAELTGDTATQIKLKAAVVVDTNSWDTQDTTRNWDKWRDANKDAIKSTSDEIDLALYNASGEIAKTGNKSLQESMSNVMKGLASPGSVDSNVFNRSLGDLIDGNYISSKWAQSIEGAANKAVGTDFVVDKAGALKIKFAALGEDAANAMKDKIIDVSEQQTLTALADEYIKMGGNASDALIKAIEDKDWAAVGKLMGEKTGKGFASAMFGAMKEGFDSRTTLEQLSSGSIANPASWIENKFIPDLKKDFGDYNSQFKMGTDESLAATKEWIDQLISIHDKYAEYLPTWFNQIIELKKKGDNELTDKEFMDVLDGVLNTTTEKVKDATKTQSVGYDNLKSTISDCADCAVSEFGQWQEAQTNLFAGSYIGQGGEAYKTYKDDSIANIRETQQAMKGYGVSVGKDYTGPEYAALDKNNTKLTADDTDLKAKLNSAKTLLDNIQTVADPVKVGANTDPFSQALQTMYNSIKPITIDVYYNELNSPGGTGGSNGFIPETTSGWDTFPSYDSGTDYVPYDQLAKIHKGEAVLTAEQNQNRGSGGNTVNIGPTIIEGDVNGVDDFEERMDRRDAELLKKMNAALKSMAKAQ